MSPHESLMLAINNGRTRELLTYCLLNASASYCLSIDGVRSGSSAAAAGIVDQACPSCIDIHRMECVPRATVLSYR